MFNKIIVNLGRLLLSTHLCLLFALGATFLSESARSGTLLYENGFENGFNNLTFECSSMRDYPGRYTNDTSQPRSGAKSMKIVNRNSAGCSDDHNKRRAEVQHNNGKNGGQSLPSSEGEELWYGMSVKFPDKNPKAIFWQSFRGNSSCPGGTPWWWHIVDGTKGVVRFSLASRTTCSNSTADKFSNNVTYSVPFGAWVDLVQRVFVSRTKGVIQIWRKDPSGYKLVVDMQNRNTYFYVNGTVGAWIKHGLYYGENNTLPDMSAYFDNIRIARGADGFALVDPTRGSNPTPTPQPAPAPVIAKPKAPSNLKAVVQN